MRWLHLRWGSAPEPLWLLAVLLFLPVAAACAGDVWPTLGPGTGRAETKIRQALDEETKVEFLETPLSDAMLFLQDRHAIPVQLDQRAIDEAGLSSDTPVNLNVVGVSLRSALRLMLRPLDLTYEIRDEVLRITSKESAKAHPMVRIYDVAPLLRGRETAADLARLLRHIGGERMPTISRRAGRRSASDKTLPQAVERDPPRIGGHRHLLVVRDTEEAQRAVAELLAALHAGLQKDEAKAKRTGDRVPDAAEAAEALKLKSDSINDGAETNPFEPFGRASEAEAAESDDDDPFAE